MADYIGHAWVNVSDPSNPQEGAIPLSAETLQEMETGIAGSLQKSGGTMTGELVLDGSEPTSPNSAISKNYTDNNYIRPCNYGNVLKTFTDSFEWTATEDCWIGGKFMCSWLESDDVTITIGDSIVYEVSGNQPNYSECFGLPPSLYVREGSVVGVSGGGIERVTIYGCHY